MSDLMNISKDGKVILENIEVAESIWKKTKGLMFRKNLPKRSGMLFIFDEDKKPGFWMFGMRFPIDIIYLDKDMKIVDIKYNVRPMGISPRSWKIHYPEQSVRYVLETCTGFSKEYELNNGDYLGF